MRMDRNEDEVGLPPSASDLSQDLLHITVISNEFNAVLPPHGSVAAEIQALLWRSRVCTAFHLVPAAEFGEIDHEMSSDVIVLGDDDEAKATVMEITSSIPRLRPLDGGSLRNAVGMETFAAVLLTVNIRHKMRASLRLTSV